MAANVRPLHGHRRRSAWPALRLGHGRYSLETVSREVLGTGLVELDQGHLERRIPTPQGIVTVLSEIAWLQQLPAKWL